MVLLVSMKNLDYISKQMINILFLFIFLLIYFQVCEVQAGSLEDDILRYNLKYPESDEVAYLPKSCMIKSIELKSLSGEIPPDDNYKYIFKSYEVSIGANMWHSFHHYCAGLNRMKRYERSKEAGIGNIVITEKQKKTLIYALAEFEYTEQYTGDPYIISRQQKASAYWDLGEYNKALNSLRQGLTKKPKTPDIYLQFAKYLIFADDFEGARTILKKGLRNTGENEIIKTMLTSLGKSEEKDYPK